MQEVDLQEEVMQVVDSQEVVMQVVDLQEEVMRVEDYLVNLDYLVNWVVMQDLQEVPYYLESNMK